MGKNIKTIVGLEGIDDTTFQKVINIENQDPSIDFFRGQGGAEAPRVIVLGDATPVPEPTLATMQSFENT